jgi:putative ABC transport system permease protein
MFKNYLKIALRNLRKNKFYSGLNIIGLALALACCILFFLFAYNELTYDAFHKNADRIWRVVKIGSDYAGGQTKQSITPSALGPTLMQTFPEIEHIVRFTWGGGICQYRDLVDRERFLLTDNAVFEMFSFELSRGNPQTALQDKRSLVISAEKALKYFGNDDPIGKVLMIQAGVSFYEFTVTGVAGKIPENSSLKFDFLLPIAFHGETLGEAQLTDWRINNAETYIQLRSPNQAAPLEKKLPEFAKKHLPKPGGDFALQPLRKMHLDTEVQSGLTPKSHPAYSYILAGLALLILLLACVNFMNLAIGQSSCRLKEIGMRKVMGAQRAQLIKQFLGEAILMCALALILGFLIAELYLPTFNKFANKNLSLWEQANGDFLLFILGMLAVVGTLAGGYPALVLSTFHPVEIIKNKFKFSGSNWFSRMLIIFQFCISIFLIISAMVMAGQFRFMKNKNLGYNDKQVVVVYGGPEVYEVYKNSIVQHRGVMEVTSGSGPFGAGLMTFNLNDAGREIGMRVYAADYNFLEVLQIPIIAGRNFDKAMITDPKDAVIVNETFVKTYGLENPIGKKLPSFQGRQNPTIIGVVKDFHFRPLYFPIEPLALYCQPSWGIFVKIKPADISSTLAFLKSKWNELAPNEAFRYDFLDEYVDGKYKTEERWGEIVRYASIFANFIACLGLLGLTLLAAVRRTKEVGIRKVLGATITNIAALLSKDFLKLVLVANLIAWPLAYFAMGKFLQNFAYRMHVGLMPFLLAGLIVLFVAIIAVSYQALKAALANPVEALRYE